MGLFAAGEFKPPLELGVMSAARVAGKGSIEVTAAGLQVRGLVVDAAPATHPVWIVLPLLVVALLVAGFVPRSERVLTPLVAAVTLGWFWWRFKVSQGRSRSMDVPWEKVEHVVRMPADPSVLGIVLSGPVAGRGTPEQLFFAPAGGIDALVVALVKEGPERLEVRVDTVPAQPPRLVAADGERIG